MGNFRDFFIECRVTLNQRDIIGLVRHAYRSHEPKASWERY